MQARPGGPRGMIYGVYFKLLRASRRALHFVTRTVTAPEVEGCKLVPRMLIGGASEF